MNQIENRVEPNQEGLDEYEEEFVAFLQTFLEDDLEEFIEYINEDQIEANCAEGNIICADDICLVSAD